MSPGPSSLFGRRLLIVGASSGIGRACALVAGHRGARVALAARRGHLLEDVRAEVGEGAVVLTCDVTDPEAAAALGGRAVAALGGLDAIIYATGTAPLGTVAETSAEDWQRTFATNVTGAAGVVRGALPHLRAARDPLGTVVLLSSHSVGAPWPGLVAYAASKAAVVELGRGLLAEEPGLGVIIVTVGNTATSFADAWEPGAAGTALEDWLAAGYLRHEVLEPDTVAEAIVDALAAGGPPELTVLGPER